MSTRTWLAVFMCLQPLVLGASVTPPAAGTTVERAVWVWEQDAYGMVENAAQRDAALRFFALHSLHTVYLYADAYGGRNLLVDAPDGYRALIAELHRRGFAVYALLGSIHLHTEEYVLPEKRETALAMLQRVLDYDAASPPEGRFDGVNLDIEPYLLDAWGQHTREIALDYLELADAFMELRKEHGSSIPVGPSMPFWFDNVGPLEWHGVSKPLSEHAQDVYDYVTLMDYRNTALGRDGIVAHAEDELGYADGVAGKRVVVGVETQESDPPKLTFYGGTAAEMERQLGLAGEALATHPSFGGFAIHHYSSYRDWLAAQSPELEGTPSPPPTAVKVQ